MNAIIASGAIMEAATDSNLRATYDKYLKDFWSNSFGTMLKTVMTLVAIVLALCLIVALVMKAMGKQNQLVMQYSNGKTIFFTILFILLLLMPSLLPPLMSMVDHLIDFLSGDASTLIGS